MKKGKALLLAALLLLSLPWAWLPATARFTDSAQNPNNYIRALWPAWWDITYAYRRQITVQNNVASSLPSGYSVKLVLNHSSLVLAGKGQANGNDVRVVYWNGSTNIELDRVAETAWDTASTEIWFKTQATIPASSSDSNYYLYYGKPSATSPPASRNNVYLFWDDFDDGSVSDWTVMAGTWAVATDQKVSGSYSLKTTTGNDSWIKPSAALSYGDVELEANMRVQGGGRDWSMAARVQSGSAKNWYEVNPEGTDWALAKMVNNAWSAVTTNTPQPVANTWYRVTLRLMATQGKVLVDGVQRVPASGYSSLGSEFSTGTIALRTWSIGTGAWYDNVKLRRFTDPEPSTSLGTEYAW